MPTYKPYPTKLTTKSRLARKGARLGIFQYNKTITPKARKAARLARREA